MRCKNCEQELTEEQEIYNWHIGKIWFCGNSCATVWAVKQLLKQKGNKK